MIDSIESAFAELQDAIQRGPIYPDVTPEEIRQHLAARFDFGSALPLDEVMHEVEQMLRSWQVQVTHPRYFGLFNPSVVLPSVVADTLVSMYNPQLASWRTSPAGNEIEKYTLDWLAVRFCLPPESVATFTTGGSEANLSAVVVALTHKFPAYAERGLRCLNATPAIYVTDEAHHSFTKIAHMTGLGREALRMVATDRDLKLDIRHLEQRVAEDRKNGYAPFMVVGTCGTTAAGVIDPIGEIGRFCRRENLWFHADAAWGGAAILSPALKHHLAGIEEADSITCDAHKWFSVAMGCGMFFCRHRSAVIEAFRAHTSYMPGQMNQQTLDPYTTSVQWSRRFIGLKLFMSLAHYGEAGYAKLIEQQSRMGDLLRERLTDTGWRIVNKTPLPVVCFLQDGVSNAQVLKALRERQIAWMSEAQCSGTPVLRACISSFRTTEEDIRWVVDELNRIAGEARVCQEQSAAN